MHKKSSFTAACILLIACAFLMKLQAQDGNPVVNCDNDSFFNNCSQQLGEYRYLKTYEGIPQNEASTYPTSNAYIFSKGNKYVLTACDNKSHEHENLVVNLYNQTRKLVASSYNEEVNRHYSKIIYNCSATGIYYIQPVLSTQQEGVCGISVLGFTNPK